MLSKHWMKVVVLAGCAAMAGCATSRSEIALSPAIADGTPVAGKVAVIRNVTDQRVFEDAPRDPSVPSLKGGNGASADADTKARALGRKRNGFGAALGDVLLQPGSTVVGEVRQHLGAALAKAGYSVVEQAPAGSSPLVIDVNIKQFWAWFTPGAFTITLGAKIETELTLSSGGAPVSVSVYSEDTSGAATEGAWREILDKALADYRTQASQKAAAFR